MIHLIQYLLGRALRALVLARMEGDQLSYAGRVGTGFTEASARHVLDEFEPLRIEKSPLAVPQEVARLGVVWVSASASPRSSTRRGCRWASPASVIQGLARGLSVGSSDPMATGRDPRCDEPEPITLGSVRYQRRRIWSTRCANPRSWRTDDDELRRPH